MSDRTVVAAVEGVSFAYGDDRVLDGVTLRLHAGEFAALVGPNGSGKSTLLRVLLGLLPAAAGTARLFGEDPARLPDRWRIGYVPQRTRIAADLPATVTEVVAAGRLARRRWWRPAGAADRAAVAGAIDAVGLGDLAGRRMRELSGGQQQRALIAKALASDPELLILDEPVAGVDSESQRRFRNALLRASREHGVAILLVSHELGAVAEDLDRVVVLKRRVVFDGTPAALRSEGVSLGVHPEDLPFWLEELT